MIKKGVIDEDTPPADAGSEDKKAQDTGEPSLNALGVPPAMYKDHPADRLARAAADEARNRRDGSR